MAKDKKKKKVTLRKAQVAEDMPETSKKDPLDDNDREQILPFKERPEEMLDETWARPGDEDKPESELPCTTDFRE